MQGFPENNSAEQVAKCLQRVLPVLRDRDSLGSSDLFDFDVLVLDEWLENPTIQQPVLALRLGRLVAGDPRYKPCTPHGIQKLLASEDIDTEGNDVVIVNRSNIVGKPLVNLLVQKSTEGNATVTVCHSRTTDLAAKTRRADILVSAIGVPGFIDKSMVTEETTVIDVGITHEETESGRKAVGDIDFESVEPVAEYITPVPGGVGPMTRAMLLYNTVEAARVQENAPDDE